MWNMIYHKTVKTHDALQSVIQYRAIVQRDRFEPQISSDSLQPVTTLCSATDEVVLAPRAWSAQSISPFRPVAPLHACLASSIKMELWGFFLIKLQAIDAPLIPLPMMM
jgi:hypothetical protein